MKQLLIGCGSSRTKVVSFDNKGWDQLVTLDMNEHHNPDVVWNLDDLPYPFSDDEFDEIHAYEVLEHTGWQGDWRFFFEQFSEFWRILKPDGMLIGTCPAITSPWLWADPGHTRAITPDTFVFLNQNEYTKQIGQTAMTDYRLWYKADFDTAFFDFAGPDKATMAFGLQAKKPSRISI